MLTDAVRSPASTLELAFQPTVPLISSTRRYVGEFVNAHWLDADAASRIALTIHELLENTLKYSTDGRARLDLALAREGGQRRVEVRASNRTTPEQVAELRRRIDTLSSTTDPMALYVEVMRESAKHDGSGLGLARIRVECEMNLMFSVQGDEVTIAASSPIGES